MGRLLSLAELWLAVLLAVACAVVGHEPPHGFRGRVVATERRFTHSGDRLVRITVEWECGPDCHERNTAEYPVPSRESALASEGRCVMVTPVTAWDVKLGACSDGD